MAKKTNNKTSKKAASTRKSQKVTLELGAPKGDKCQSRRSGHTGFLLGARNENYPFDDTAKMVANVVSAISQPGYQLPQVQQKEVRAARPCHFRFPLPPKFLRANTNQPKAPLSAKRREAQGLMQVMEPEMYARAAARMFDDQYGVVTRDKRDLPTDWHATCDSLAAQLRELEARVTEVFPQAMAEVQQKFPEANTAQVFTAVMQLLQQQLGPILSTLGIWTMGIKQWLDPKYHRALRILKAKIEQNLALLLVGDLNFEKPGEWSERLNSLVKVRDLVIPVLLGPMEGGPAVIPVVDGTYGPLGAHAMFFPMEMLSAIASSDPIYSHEAGHLFMAAVEGLADEFQAMIPLTLKQAEAAGNIKLINEYVELMPGKKVKTVQLLTKLASDQIGELFADVIGCLVSGAPAFAATFTSYIGAMGAMVNGGVENVPHLFRSSSSYKLVPTDDGHVELHFEEHPTDNSRIGEWLAEVARLTGFSETAQECADLAKKESEDPTECSWDFDGPTEQEEGAEEEGLRAKLLEVVKKLRGGKKAELPVIRLRIEDYAAMVRLLGNAFLNTKAKSLGGRTLKEWVCLTPQMHQEKVMKLAGLLKQGVGKLPEDGRKYWLHHVGAAASMAYTELVAECTMPASKAASLVNTAGEDMMYALTEQWEELLKKQNADPQAAASAKPGLKRTQPKQKAATHRQPAKKTPRKTTRRTTTRKKSGK